MAQEFQGIIAGTSVNNENLITPDFDRRTYDFIIGQSGHNLVFNVSGTTLVANGIVINAGMRAYFENATIDIGTNGYVVAQFIINNDENQADSVFLKWVTTPEEANGTGIMQVLRILNGVGSILNKISYPKNAQNAEIADEVEQYGYLLAGVTAETAVKGTANEYVATTAFVQNEIDYEEKIYSTTYYYEFASGVSTTAYHTYTFSIRLRRKCNYVIADGTLTNSGTTTTQPSSQFSFPDGFIPKETRRITIYIQPISANDNYSGTIQLQTIANSNSISTVKVSGFSSGATFNNEATFSFGYECQ